MENLVEWIERAANGEPIEAIVIAPEYGADYREPDELRRKGQKTNVLLSWEEARPMLDYPFDCGYGSPECNAVTAWTKSSVIVVGEYDGSTRIYAIPRNPVPHEPFYV